MSFASRTCLAAAALAVLVVGQQTRAVLIVNDPFLIGSDLSSGQYDTTVRLNSATSVPTVLGMVSTGWTGGAGTSQPHVVAGTLDVSGAGYESGGKVQFDSAPIDGVYRSNARTIVTPYTSAGANGPLYISGIVATDPFAAIPADNGLRGYALMGFTNTIGANTTGTLAGYYLGFRANADDSMSLILRHRNGTASTLADIVLLPVANPSTDYQFILRTDVNVIGGNQETVHWWINPSDVTSETTATNTALAAGTFNDYSLQNSTADISRLTVATYNWDATSYYDEFRMGTTFLDVAGAATPEPASLSLLAIPALLTLRRRTHI
ncbi:MAG TPA: hypothetical protein VFE58_10155 [Tepidisphaeraceae bacterium]|jgi:hypothetical protein|nr:hypothetical protein [Tepidisphaeraceae bacterium]